MKFTELIQIKLGYKYYWTWKLSYLESFQYLLARYVSLIFLSVVTTSFILILSSGESATHSMANPKIDDIHCFFAMNCSSSPLNKLASTTSVIEPHSESPTQFFMLISSEKISSVGLFLVTIPLEPYSTTHYIRSINNPPKFSMTWKEMC